MSREKLLRLLRDNKLSESDEICPGNHFWVYVKERALLAEMLEAPEILGPLDTSLSDKEEKKDLNDTANPTSKKSVTINVAKSLKLKDKIKEKSVNTSKSKYIKLFVIIGLFISIIYITISFYFSNVLNKSITKIEVKNFQLKFSSAVAQATYGMDEIFMPGGMARLRWNGLEYNIEVSINNDCVGNSTLYDIIWAKTKVILLIAMRQNQKNKFFLISFKKK